MSEATKSRREEAGGAARECLDGHSNVQQAYSTTPAGGRQDLLLPNGRTGGVLFGTTLRKVVVRSKHMSTKFLTFGIDLSILEKAAHHGAVTCEICDQETGAVLRAPLALVLEAGMRANLGAGEQVFLPLTCWERIDRQEAAHGKQ